MVPWDDHTCLRLGVASMTSNPTNTGALERKQHDTADIESDCITYAERVRIVQLLPHERRAKTVKDLPLGIPRELRLHPAESRRTFPFDEPWERELVALYRKHCGDNWNFEEIKKHLDQDMKDWRTVARPKDRRRLKIMHAFFAHADELVGDNLGERLLPGFASVPLVVLCLADQMQREVGPHSETYTMIPMRMVPDPEELSALLKENETRKSIRDKGAWVARYSDESTVPFVVTVIAWSMYEMVLFQGSFATINQWRSAFDAQGNKNVFPGLGMANEWISRDENHHGMMGRQDMNYIAQWPPEAYVQEMMRGAVETESAYIRDLYPDPIPVDQLPDLKACGAAREAAQQALLDTLTVDKQKEAQALLDKLATEAVAKGMCDEVYVRRRDLSALSVIVLGPPPLFEPQEACWKRYEAALHAEAHAAVCHHDSRAVPGLQDETAAKMIGYIEFLADKILAMLDCAPLYNHATCPIKDMENHASHKQVAFFERINTGYASAAARAGGAGAATTTSGVTDPSTKARTLNLRGPI